MEPHQQRVVDEKIELDEKLNKLTAFVGLNNSIFNSLPSQEQLRLSRQRHIMEQYLEVLGERIAAFE